MKLSTRVVTKKWITFLLRIMVLSPLLLILMIFLFGHVFLRIIWWFNQPNQDPLRWKQIIERVLESDGVFPLTKDDFVSKTFLNLNEYIYVGGILTNDPPLTPILIKPYSWFPSRGWILTIGGSYYFFNEYSKEKRNNYLQEPWSFVEHNFQTPHEYVCFTNRLQLYKVTKQ